MAMTHYDRKLARAVYAMVLLAVANMVLAGQSPVYLALAAVAAMISWPIAHGRSGQSVVPRWLISLTVLTALLFFLFELRSNTHLVEALAHFMVFVQVCKFFETKRARDYGQLIVLSVLEVIIAAILSVSVAFVVLLVVYLALGSYTLVLYHFKHEMELFERTGRQRHALAPAAAALADATESLGRIRPWRFWRFSGSAGAVAMAIGATLFVCFPRIGEGWLARAGLGPIRPPITGFSETPQLGVPGLVQQSDELVFRVALLENGRPIEPTSPLLLRGSVAWAYDDRSGVWRDRFMTGEPPGRFTLADRSAIAPLRSWSGPLADEREVRIEMYPLQTQFLFAPLDALGIRSADELAVYYNRANQTLTTRSAARSVVNYSVWVPRDPGRVATEARPVFDPRDATTPRPERARLASEWAADARTPTAKAEAIAAHLRRDYTYTLDIPPSPKGRDPLDVFLFETRRGHCQYFASALAVLCQQLGIPARLVTGFKAVEFNAQGHYYIVRQKHAHAWVEVFIDSGRGRGRWISYDPTPGSEHEGIESPAGVAAWFDNTIDYLNYRFQQRVLNYSQADRQAVLTRTAEATSGLWRRITDRLRSARAMIVYGLVFVAAVTLLLLRRKRSRARAHDRALRQQGLGFWADLLAVLDRARIQPVAALTPRELAHRLADELPDVPGLDKIGEWYYEVRYGQRTLPDDRQQAIRATLDSLRQTLRR